MSFDGSGKYNRLYRWVNDRDANIAIMAERMDNEFDEIANALTAIVQGNQPFKGALRGPDGSATAPTFSFENANTTGIFRKSGGGVSVTVAGTEKASIESDGLHVDTIHTQTIYVTGTVDGRDVSADGATLDAINSDYVHNIPSPTVGNLIQVASADGRNLADAGVSANELARGAASSGANNLVLFADTSGKNLIDSGHEFHGLVTPADTYSDLQALPSSLGIVFVKGRDAVDDGGGGYFVWVDGDQSANVSYDPLHGIWVPPLSDQSGSSGAWKRIINGKIRPQYFGARGDGISDDTSAIIEAIKHASVVFFPKGTYIVSETIDVSNTDLIGETVDTYRNNDLVIIEASSSFNGTELFKQTTYTKLGVNWKNIKLRGNGQIDGIKFLYTVNSIFENVIIENVKDGITFGENATTAGSQFNTFMGCTIKASQYGIVFNGDYPNKNAFINCWIEGDTAALHVNDIGSLCAGNAFVACEFWSDGGICVKLDDATQNISFDSCYFEKFTKAVEVNTSLANIKVTSCMFGVQNNLVDDCIIHMRNISNIEVNSAYVYVSEEQNKNIYLVKTDYSGTYKYRSRIYVKNTKVYSTVTNTNVLNTNTGLDDEHDFLVTNKLVVKGDVDATTTNTHHKTTYGVEFDDLSTKREVVRVKEGALQYGYGVFYIVISVSGKSNDNPYLYGGHLELLVGVNDTSITTTELRKINVREANGLTYIVERDGDDLVVSLEDTQTSTSSIRVMVDVSVVSRFADLV